MGGWVAGRGWYGWSAVDCKGKLVWRGNDEGRRRGGLSLGGGYGVPLLGRSCRSQMHSNLHRQGKEQ